VLFDKLLDSVSYPINENRIVSALTDVSIIYFPSLSVIVPTVVLARKTDVPVSGTPVLASITVPLITLLSEV
jgi:hypothetical protein